jgi:hypothetical protein
MGETMLRTVQALLPVLFEAARRTGCAQGQLSGIGDVALWTPLRAAAPSRAGEALVAGASNNRTLGTELSRDTRHAGCTS